MAFWMVFEWFLTESAFSGGGGAGKTGTRRSIFWFSFSISSESKDKEIGYTEEIHSNATWPDAFVFKKGSLEELCSPSLFLSQKTFPWSLFSFFCAIPSPFLSLQIKPLMRQTNELILSSICLFKDAKLPTALIFPSNWCYPHSGQMVESGMKRVAVTWYYVENIMNWQKIYICYSRK